MRGGGSHGEGDGDGADAAGCGGIAGGGDGGGGEARTTLEVGKASLSSSLLVDTDLIRVNFIRRDEE